VKTNSEPATAMIFVAGLWRTGVPVNNGDSTRRNVENGVRAVLPK